MVMRVGGLASGMDIDALVEKLMAAEKSPLNKLQQKKQTYEWQRDAYRSVNTKLKTFDTYIADNLVIKNINSKTAATTNSNLVSATATGKAAGTVSIEGVSQLATSARGISDVQKAATGSTKLSELGINESSISLRAIQADGTMATKATKIDIETNMTVDQLMNKINSSSAGVSALFENGKLSITAKNTGDIKNGAEVVVDSGASVFGKFGFSHLTGESGNLASGGTNAIFEVNGIAAERSTNSFSINGYNVTLKDTFNSTATDFMSRYSNASAENLTATAALSSLTTTRDEIAADLGVKQQELNDAMTASNKIAIYTSLNSQSFFKELTEDEIVALKDFVYNAPTDEADKDQQIDASSLSEGLKNKLKNGFDTQQLASIANLDEADIREFQHIAIKEEALSNSTAALEAANLKVGQATLAIDNYNSIVDEAKDSGYWDITNNKLNLNAVNATKTTAPVTLTSTTNVDEMMDKIKDFVKTYNGLINDFNDQTKQTKYRDYAPLTDDQRKDMEENEIKLWEEKAKSGLLKNDSLVRTGLSNMRALVYQTNPGLSDSKYNSLYSIGITTTKNYNDGGQLEINEDKLRAAIEADPDAVERLFKNTEGKKEDIIDGNKVDTRGYIEKLRESMKNLEISIESKAGRSTMTEQQYTLGKNLVDTNKRIDSWSSKLKMLEERYWKQFTEMEKAISKGNEQSSMFFQQ